MYADKLQAIKYRLPLPQSMVDANLDMWTETINRYLDNARLLHTDINPTTLHACTVQAAEKLMKQEYFVNKIQKSLQNEINLTTLAHPQDAVMLDPADNMTKMEHIQKTTAIWQNTAKALWQDNTLTCNQETLDQATHLLLLEDTTHKYASLSEAEIYDTELDQCDCIIMKITELNENVAKIIKDIQQKPTASTIVNKVKLELIKKQGWETAKCNVTQNPTKFSPTNIPLTQYPKIVLDIVNDLKDKEDDSWEVKILKDVKNKGIQAKALESRIQTIISSTPATTPTPQLPLRAPSTSPAELPDQEMAQADPIPWTDTEEYNQNHQLWINTASETFEKLAPYFPTLERKQKEELFWEAVDICAHQDKELLQLQSISSFMDSNKKCELENMRKLLIDKEYQSLLNVTVRQEAAKKKDTFEDYLATKDFDYYMQHAKDQISNPSVLKEKKSTLKTILKDAEKWQPKHRVDNDGSILPDSPPPSPIPKQKTKLRKQKEDTQKAAKLSRKGNTPNTCHLQTLLNELNADNGLKIMKEIHRISDKDKINSAKQQLVKPTMDKSSYAQKATPKEKKKDP
ncbi:hypothetical protein AMATHDRAFT_8552 [Amanita thiersii Skay4041]|uniref:Uncharacterized protein n=1 Tax=Amanita thiersii Skay4041 TaxID=703135 RepID=A0A2A9NDZ3_9AGAR|nr:hypothetical protein AMATHDRAFT_8552 [Amanita thiersii Skay4041]